MKWIKVIRWKAFRLFVDDGYLAVASALWLVVVWLILPYLSISSIWRGVALFLGLTSILMASVLRRATSRKEQSAEA